MRASTGKSGLLDLCDVTDLANDDPGAIQRQECSAAQASIMRGPGGDPFSGRLWRVRT